MAKALAKAEKDVEVVREIVAFIREHADELRGKGLPVDEMVRDLEQKIEEVLVAAREVDDLAVQDELLTKKREGLRRDIDELTRGLPPDLVDGVATIQYLHGAAEREAADRRRPRKGLGG